MLISESFTSRSPFLVFLILSQRRKLEKMGHPMEPFFFTATQKSKIKGGAIPSQIMPGNTDASSRHHETIHHYTISPCKGRAKPRRYY